MDLNEFNIVGYAEQGPRGLTGATGDAPRLRDAAELSVDIGHSGRMRVGGPIETPIMSIDSMPQSSGQNALYFLSADTIVVDPAAPLARRYKCYAEVRYFGFDKIVVAFSETGSAPWTAPQVCSFMNGAVDETVSNPSVMTRTVSTGEVKRVSNLMYLFGELYSAGVLQGIASYTSGTADGVVFTRVAAMAAVAGAGGQWDSDGVRHPVARHDEVNFVLIYGGRTAAGVDESIGAALGTTASNITKLAANPVMMPTRPGLPADPYPRNVIVPHSMTRYPNAASGDRYVLTLSDPTPGGKGLFRAVVGNTSVALWTTDAAGQGMIRTIPATGSFAGDTTLDGAPVVGVYASPNVDHTGGLSRLVMLSHAVDGVPTRVSQFPLVKTLGDIWRDTERLIKVDASRLVHVNRTDNAAVHTEWVYPDTYAPGDSIRYLVEGELRNSRGSNANLQMRFRPGGAGLGDTIVIPTAPVPQLRYFKFEVYVYIEHENLIHVTGSWEVTNAGTFSAANTYQNELDSLTQHGQIRVTIPLPTVSPTTWGIDASWNVADPGVEFVRTMFRQWRTGNG